MVESKLETGKPNRRIAHFNDMAAAGLLLLAALVLSAAYFLIAPPPTIRVASNINSYSTAAAGQKQGAGANKDLVKTPVKPVVKTPVAPPPPDPAYKLTFKDGALDFDSRSADFYAHTLDDVGLIGNKGQGVDAWRGESDHSLRVWVGHDTDFLVVRADVTDDVHIQTLGEKDVYYMFRDDCLQLAFIAEGWKAQWEFGFALGSSGELLRTCWIAPDIGPFQVVSLHRAKLTIEAERIRRILDSIQFTAVRIPGGLRYLIRIPMKEVGISMETLRKGLRFNVSAPDTDDSENPQESWIEITDGIMAHKITTRFAEIKFEK